jgi:cyclic pyranopterin phosphate synthase
MEKTKKTTKKKKAQLSHIGTDRRPRMVDVSKKKITNRTAIVECWMIFPKGAVRALKSADLRSKKGPVIDTAVIAGTLAIKRTHELIPFCHPLMLEHSDIHIDFVGDEKLRIMCHVQVRGRTGVEMEAMTGASIAALTIYDMCKSLSHDIRIESIRVLEKKGGRSGTWKAGHA